MKIEEQKRAVRSGYDMDVLPSDLVTYGEEAVSYTHLQDGICQVTKNFFSKTIQFYDINYQLALNEDKTCLLYTSPCF